MRFFLALAFVFTTSAAFACDHDQASNDDSGRTVASAKAETGKTKTTDDGGSCGEAGCSCGKDAKGCHCEHGKHDKSCGCGHCGDKAKGKTS